MKYRALQALVMKAVMKAIESVGVGRVAGASKINKNRHGRHWALRRKKKVRKAVSCACAAPPLTHASVALSRVQVLPPAVDAVEPLPDAEHGAEAAPVLAPPVPLDSLEQWLASVVEVPALDPDVHSVQSEAADIQAVAPLSPVVWECAVCCAVLCAVCCAVTLGCLGLNPAIYVPTCRLDWPMLVTRVTCLLSPRPCIMSWEVCMDRVPSCRLCVQATWL
jgi:hypothetical protein